MLKLLTLEDLAEILQMSPHTLQSWRTRAPDLLPPSVQIGRNVRYHPDTVERWMKAKDAKGQRLFGEK